jgi:hypothetical protein
MPIFESYDANSHPTGFLKSSGTGKSFGELEPGDTLYVHRLNEESYLNIREVKVTSKVMQRNNQIYINIEPTPAYEGQRKKFWESKLIMGPANGGAAFEFCEEYHMYSPFKVAESNTFVNHGDLTIFGTDMEEVKKWAVKGIEVRIKRVREEIENLNLKLKRLENKIS